MASRADKCQRQGGQEQVDGEIEREDAAEHAVEFGARGRRASGREPAEREGEDGEQHHPKPEFGRRAGDENRGDANSLDPGAAFPGQQHTSEDTKEVGDDERGKGQKQRVGKNLPDEVGDLLLVEEAFAELEMGEVPEVEQILFKQRLVQAELVAQDSCCSSVKLGLMKAVERIARHQPEDQEEDGRYRPQDEQQLPRLRGDEFDTGHFNRGLPVLT